jgi:hypothetical protein
VVLVIARINVAAEDAEGPPTCLPGRAAGAKRRSDPSFLLSPGNREVARRERMKCEG